MKKAILVMAMAIALAMSTVATAIASSTIGNEALPRTSVDSFANFTIVDTNNPADMDGTIDQVEFYAHRAGTVQFVIVGSNNEVMAISDPYTADAAGVHFAPFEAGVTQGDNIAVYSQGGGVVSFVWSGEPAEYTPNGNGLPEVGATLLIVGSSNRTYSMNAAITPAPEPTKDACKDSGWMEFYDEAGEPVFRNQGQCVSSFQANERAGK